MEILAQRSSRATMRMSQAAILRRKPFIASPAHRFINTNTAKPDQTLTLPDGRTLGYAEYGCPTGIPLFYFHGFPSSRLESSAIDEMGHRRQIRVISPDRPGFGISTYQSGRRINDFPADVKFLAKHLDISRFAVLGGSGGGPYALACAHALPRDMVSAVGLLASAGPWEAGKQGLLLSEKFGHWASTRWPGGLVKLTDTLLALIRWALTTRRGKNYFDAQLGLKAPKPEDNNDGKVMTLDELRDQTIHAVFETFAQGSKACVQEARLLSTDWDIPFEDVDYNKVQIWHGVKDVNSPVRLMRYIAKRLPNADLREYPDDDHWTVIKHLEDIISELMPEAKK